MAKQVKPVEKPNGELRLTTNLIALNKIVELNEYSLPRISEIISKLIGNSVFSKIDLKEGFSRLN